jgi:hypothetical protein
MKRFIICILLILYVFTQLGTILYYDFQPIIHTACYYQWRCGNKSTRWDYILVLDSTEYLAAKKEDEEIYWQGALYDIRSIQANGSKLMIYAEEDSAESKWLNAYNELRSQFKKNQSSQAPLSLNIIKWLFKIYSPGSHQNIQNFNLHIKIDLCLHKESTLPNHYRKGPIRPPDFIA